MQSIVIADDHPLVAEGLKALINATPGLRVAHSVSSGKELLDLLESELPGLIILDLSMPELDGVETSRLVRKKYPLQKILCISTFYEQSLYDTLKKIPVQGFVPKLADTGTIIDCIRAILQGETVFIKPVEENPEIKRLLLTEISGKLSKREIAIIKLIREKKSNKEISSALSITTGTVETHRKNICKKLNINSHNGLYNFALEHF